MNFKKVLSDLYSERDRLNKAIAAIEGLSGAKGKGGATNGRRGARRKRGPMSAAARKKISQMMKLRWAERKKKSA